MICLLSQGFVENHILKKICKSIKNSGFLTGTVQLLLLWDIISDRSLLSSYLLENFNFIKAIRSIQEGLIPIFVKEQLTFECCINRVYVNNDVYSDLDYFIGTCDFLSLDWFKSNLKIRLLKSEDNRPINDILGIKHGSDILYFSRDVILSKLYFYASDGFIKD